MDRHSFRNTFRGSHTFELLQPCVAIKRSSTTAASCVASTASWLISLPDPRKCWNLSFQNRSRLTSTVLVPPSASHKLPEIYPATIGGGPTSTNSSPAIMSQVAAARTARCDHFPRSVPGPCSRKANTIKAQWRQLHNGDPSGGCCFAIRAANVLIFVYLSSAWRSI